MAQFPDEVEQLRQAGVDAALYLYDKMGIGLARSSLAEIDAIAESTEGESGSPGGTQKGDSLVSA